MSQRAPSARDRSVTTASLAGNSVRAVSAAALHRAAKTEREDDGERRVEHEATHRLHGEESGGDQRAVDRELGDLHVGASLEECYAVSRMPLGSTNDDTSPSSMSDAPLTSARSEIGRAHV